MSADTSASLLCAGTLLLSLACSSSASSSCDASCSASSFAVPFSRGRVYSNWNFRVGCVCVSMCVCYNIVLQYVINKIHARQPLSVGPTARQQRATEDTAHNNEFPQGCASGPALGVDCLSSGLPHLMSPVFSICVEHSSARLLN